MTRSAKKGVRVIGACQTFIEHLGRNCSRRATTEFHERDTKTAEVTALPVCLQHARKFLAEAKKKRHRKAWLGPIGGEEHTGRATR